MTEDLWWLLGYSLVFVLLEHLPSLLYREAAPLEEGAPFLYPHRRGVLAFVLTGATAAAAIAFLGGTVGVGLVFGWSSPVYIHGAFLGAGLGLAAFRFVGWWTGARTITRKSKRQRIAVRRGGWRWTLEWCCLLGFVVATAVGFASRVAR